MNTEELIAKGVKKHFNGQVVLFVVASLLEHFDGIHYQESDIIPVQEWEGDDVIEVIDCIKASDVNFANAVAKEVSPMSEDPESLLLEIGMTYEEAEKELKAGNLIALPEWEGFWFKNLNGDINEVLELTKEGEITNTPFEDEEFKERNDWVVVNATPEQFQKLNAYFLNLESQKNVGSEAKSETPTKDIVVNEAETVVVDTKEVIEDVPVAVEEPKAIKKFKDSKE